METKTLRKALLFWGYFIGIGAMIGSSMMFIDPSGQMWHMEPMLPILQKGLPILSGLFNNFIASGIVLFLVNGVTNTVSVILIHRKSRLTTLSSALCGTILMCWTLFELFIFGDATIIILYFTFGLLQMLTGLWMMKNSNKEEYC